MWLIAEGLGQTKCFMHTEMRETAGGCMRETADPPRLLEHMLNSPEEEPLILPWLSCGFEASPLSYKRTNRHMIGYFYDTTFYLKRFSGPLRLSTERSAPSQNALQIHATSRADCDACHMCAPTIRARTTPTYVCLLG